MTTQSRITLESAADLIQFDARSGRLQSFRRQTAPEIEFIDASADTPVFAIQYLGDDKRFRTLSDAHATRVQVELHALSDTRQQVVAQYQGVGGFDLNVTAIIEADKNERLTRWSLRLHNQTNLHIISVEYPFVIVSYTLDNSESDRALVLPIGAGILIKNPQPHDLHPDAPLMWQMRSENTAVLHYPGFITAQFMAYYNASAGIYIAAEDTQGCIKMLKAVHRDGGIRLGIAHIGDWDVGERNLEYDVVLGSFTGDWYAAAALYRSWSGQQHWCQLPLHKRQDVPDWLLESPPHLMVRMQGELDSGPAEPNTAFLPYPKILPLLEKVSKRIEAPVVPVIMSWERGGPWVYPDCFPPVGGDSLVEFTARARERGWHVGTFSNGTRWVVGHLWSGYDGMDYFDAHHAEQGISRTFAGELWAEQWDAAWRPSFVCCLGARQTMETAQDYVQRVIDYGIDWIQFLDQNVGACTFPCYSHEHGHPPAPGRWMTEAMLELTAFFRQKQAEAADSSGGARKLVFSVEGPVTEYLLQSFQICDIRVVPPNHLAAHPWWTNSIPLYQFLFHEYILMQGGFGHGADPHHLAIRNAYNFVVGEIPGAVLKGDGRLLNSDNPGINWAPWEPHIGDDEEALAMLHTTTAMRRGPGKPYLVFGKMLPPAAVTAQMIEWRQDRTLNSVPAVFHAAWQSPDGTFAVVLANWTQQPQSVTVTDVRLQAARVRVQLAAPAISSIEAMPNGESITIEIPPLGCALIEVGGAS